MTDFARVRQTAVDVINLGAGMDPREFLAALALAAGTAIVACWPAETRGECLDTFDENTRAAVELKAKGS